MIRHSLLALSALTALLLAACGGGKSGTATADLQDAPRDIMPAAPIMQNLPEYRVQTGDVLSVKFILNPELDEEVTVRPDGMISTAVVQDLPAVGRTPEELRRLLVNEYKRHLKDPQLTVIVRSYAPNRVYVLGEVQNPGELVSVGPNMTLLQALARAGGVRNSADTEEILIFRRGSGDKPEVYRADYNAATEGGLPTEDIRLASYDVVFVPRTAVADAYIAWQQNVQQFLPTSFGLGYSVP